MSDHTCRFVSLAIASVAIPAGSDEMSPATTHLAAIGMLIAERDRDLDWHFALETCAIGAGESEDVLLVWATNIMPDSGIVLGWQLAEAIVPLLLDAGTSGDPEIGRAFLDRLMKLVTVPSVDLAVPHGGAGAPPFVDVADRHGIVVPVGLDVESAWAFGNLPMLRDHVAAQAVATWRLWLAESNGTAVGTSAAFAEWLDR